jgi:hypothetical protein
MTNEQQISMDGAIDKFSHLAELKYRAGQDQHGGQLWEKKGLLWKAKEEVIDLWFYLDALEKQIELKTIYTANGVDIDE